MADDNASRTFLFTDIEGSSQLWEEQPLPMRAALAWHDRELRACVEAAKGEVVKRTGDGLHAAFADPMDALRAAVDIQRRMAQPPAEVTLPLLVRCGLHCGFDEARDGDYFGTDVNRAARVMGVAHGGQVLMSEAVRARVAPRLPDAQPDWRLKDLGRVRLRSFAQAASLTQLCAPGLREAFPPLRAMEDTPHNLPAASTRFFNRVRELAELKDLLPAERLVLLHGLGGMGKTRLALEAARLALEQFEDGVWFVELSQVTDPALVPLALAGVLGVKEEVGRTLTAAIVQVLAPRRALIVLDNCEQVVEACARLVDELLARAPQVHVLVTSREHLRLTAERVLEVGGFELPAAASARATAAELERIDAVSLFVDRVRAVQPSFRLDDTAAGPVRDICRRLDGIPLALELAAAAARRMPLASLAQRLDDRLGTLVHGQRVASERQKTLRGLIDWSHDLLTPAQQQVFRRLGVFAGGWTLEAAEAVCASEAVRADEVVERLGELVEKSLVRMDLIGGRYDMLDTVRQYARERLASEAPEAASAASAHLAFYLDLAERARPHLGGPEQKTWLTTLDLERDNVLAAHQACATLPDGGTRAVRLSWAMKPYWLNRGLLGLGLRVAMESLDWLDASIRDTARCTALFDLGQLCFFVGQYRRAQAYLRDCIDLARELKDRLRETAALQPLAMASLSEGDVVQAMSYLREARSYAAADQNLMFLAYIDNALSQVTRASGDYQAALAQNRAAHEEALALGAEDLQIIALLNESMIVMAARAPGYFEAALSLLRKAVVLNAEGQSLALVQSALEVACALACDARKWVEAEEFWSWAEAYARHSGLRRDPADELFLRPFLESLHDHRGSAHVTRAVHSGEMQPAPVMLSRIDAWLDAVLREAVAAK